MKRGKLGIIGGGIAGLTCGYELQNDYEVTVFEKEGKLGGHADTFTTKEGYKIDNKVLVFNKRTFKCFFNLMKEIGFSNFSNKVNLTTIVQDKNRVLFTNVSRLKSVIRSPCYFLKSFVTLIVYLSFIYKLKSDYYKNKFKEDDLIEDISNYFPYNYIFKGVIKNWFIPYSSICAQRAVTLVDFCNMFFDVLGAKFILTMNNDIKIAKNGSEEYIDLIKNKTDAEFFVSSKVVKVNKNNNQFEVYVEGEKDSPFLFDRLIIATEMISVRHFLDFYDPTLYTLFSDIDKFYETTLVVIHTDDGIFQGVPRECLSFGSILYDEETAQSQVTFIPSSVFPNIGSKYLYSLFRTQESINHIEELDWTKVGLPKNLYKISREKILKISSANHFVWGTPGLSDRLRAIQEYSEKDGLYFSGTGLAYPFLGHEGAVRSAMMTVEKIRSKPSNI